MAIIDAAPLIAEELKADSLVKKQEVNYFVTEDALKFSTLAKKIGQPLMGKVEELHPHLVS